VQGNIGEERVGKQAIPVLACQVIEDRAQLARQCLRVDARLHPVIKTEGGELPFQDGRSAEKAAWRFDGACQHLQWLHVKVQIMRSPVRHRQGKRVAVPAARASNPLQVARLRWRHAAQDCRRQITNVDPHFERWRAR
jgi:hypothetical protein